MESQSETIVWLLDTYKRPDCMQTRTTEEEILRTLRDINRTAVETDQISAQTAEVINAQGEQINNIARNADKIEENLNTSDRLIRGFKGWSGRLANFISGPPTTSESSTGEKYPSYMPKAALGPPQSVAPPATRPQTASVKPANEFDQEMDKQLDQISNVLCNIHARSLELSDSIARQVETVESVDRSIDKSNDRIKKQHEDIKRFR
jgi:septal ring factor EnvC (AmiA/AmiB activator)